MRKINTINLEKSREKIALINKVSEFEKNNTVLHSNRYLFYKYYEEAGKLFLEKIR